MDPLTSDLAGLIAVLSDHEVEFIVVGGTAAVLLGAPLTTLDVDVVYRQTHENAEKLLRALTFLGAAPRRGVKNSAQGENPGFDGISNGSRPVRADSVSEIANPG